METLSSLTPREFMLLRERRTPEQQAQLNEEVRQLFDPRFEYDSTLSYGTEDSAKEVFFGTVGGATIGVKPFQGLSLRERASHECAMMAIARERGFVTFANPRVVNGSYAEYLITDYMPGVRAMNTVGWEHQIDSSAYLQQNKPLLREMSIFAGVLHARGISHGDFALKNIARLSSGTFVVPDLERAQDVAGYSADTQASAFLGDMTSFLNSLIRKRFLNTPDWSAIEGELLDSVVVPYVETFTAHGKNHEIALAAVFQALFIAQQTHQAVYRSQ